MQPSIEELYLPALCGCDYIRGMDWRPVRKNRRQWERWAEKEAKVRSRDDRFQWHGVVVWLEDRECYRISFGSQAEIR